MAVQQGSKFGLLTAVSKGRLVGRNRYWLCVCACGSEKEIAAASLSRGATKSCGCLNSKLSSERRKTHGLSRTREHSVWLGMRQRCSDKNHPSFKNYGGRGICVCDRWQSFELFFADMGPSNGGTIERQDNNKGYEPGNCVWASCKTQANNRRTNRLIKYKGRKKTIKQWSEILGIPYFTLYARLTKLGWSVTRAFTESSSKQTKE